MTLRDKVWSRSPVAFLMLVLLLDAGRVRGELGVGCVVSLLNRTARVQEDGSWAIPNVPAGFGPIRVRATCVDEAGVRTGQSGLFEIPANGAIEVEDIAFQAPLPVPAELTLTAPVATLTQAGQIAQLLTQATFADGSGGDYTAPETGTSYRSSNPAVATVSESGIVTAVASGTVLLSALNEGALGVLRLQVVLSGDSDGDGLPDDWELANGFDPNDPVDAFDDPDRDGLSTSEEYALGTGPTVADTDHDGLADGEEVDAVGTDPLLWDTDGDGISDGLEVQTGSDPFDPTSFNLAGALVGYEVSPTAFRLVHNTVYGESFRTLRVTGTLRDGRTIDLRRRSYGTQYASSDLEIASFGADDGRVYAGQAGLATVTVSTAGFSATSQVEVEVFSPAALSRVAIPGFANALDVAGDYALVAAGATGLQVVDVSDPAAPFVAGAIETPGIAGDVRIAGNLAWVADGAAGLRGIDVSDPVAPVELGAVSLTDEAYGVDADGELAVVAANTGLAIIDVSVPAAPVEVGWLPLPGVVRHVELDGTLAYVSSFGQGITVVDVSNPAAPVGLGEVDLRPGIPDKPVGGLAVREGIAYVADGFAGRLGGLAVVDARAAASPGLVGRSSDDFGLTEVALEGSLAFAADYLLSNDVPIFRGGEGAPAQVGRIDFPLSEQGTDVVARDGLVYLTGAATGASPRLRPGVTSTSALHIGRYARLARDDADAPVVTFTSPAEGAALEERTRTTVVVEVADASRIDAVTLEVDGAGVGSDFRPPYSFDVAVPSGAGPVELRALARDEAGNEGDSSVAHPRLPNARPVAWLVAPAEGQSVPKGAWYTVVAGASDDQAVTRVEIRINGSLVATRTSPPFRFEAQVHPATTAESFTVAVQAFDALGGSEVVARTVPIAPDAPPLVALTAPGEGDAVVEGGIFRARVSATDDVRVSQIRLYVDGVLTATSGQSEREFGVVAEPGATTVALRAEATDSRDQVGTSAELVLAVVPEPGSAVRGRVLDPAGAPVAGATVTVVTDTQSFGQATGGDGTFEIAGLPSIDGDLEVSAEAEIAGIHHSYFAPEALTSVPGGVLELGDLVLEAAGGWVTLSGRTVDLSGSPLAGVEVFAFDLFVGYETVSGPDGRFSIPDVESRDSYTVGGRLVVGDQLWLGSGFVEPLRGITDAGDIVVDPAGQGLDPGTTAHGAVTFEATGEPVANLPVQVSTAHGFVRTVTNADGLFTVAAPAREGWLWAASETTVAGTRFFGWTEAEPVEGGTTDLGTLWLNDDTGIPHFVDPRRSLAGRQIGRLVLPVWHRAPACVVARTSPEPLLRRTLPLAAGGRWAASRALR